MNWYTVEYFVDQGDNFFLTKVRIKADSKEDAISKLKTWYSKQSRWLGKRKPRIEIFEVTVGKSENENALDMLWIMHKSIYLELWDQGITTIKMISKLKNKYPEIWSEIS